MARNPKSPKKFLVQGRITTSAGNALVGVVVRVYDQDLRKRQRLGETKTDDKGAYLVTYAQEQALSAEKHKADLLVIAFNLDDEELVRSSVRFNAQPHETIDLVVKFPQATARSEFETVMATVMPLLEGQDVHLYMLEETAAHRDISFLVRETGLPSARIIALVNAARLANDASTGLASAHRIASSSAGRESQPAVRPSSAKPTFSNRPRKTGSAGRPAQQGPAAIGRQTDGTPSLPLLPALYGLLRQGLAPDLSALLNLSATVLRTDLKESLQQNIIPASLASQLDQIINTLQSLKASQLLRPPAADAPVSFGDLLSAALTPDARERVASLYVANGLNAGVFRPSTGDPTLKDVEASAAAQSFWTNLESANLPPAQVARLKAVVTFDRLTQSYLPLVKELSRVEGSGPTLLEPKGLGALTEGDWLKILARPKDPANPDSGSIGHPSGFDSDAAYAKALVARVEEEFPTSTFVIRITDVPEKGADPFRETRPDLTAFFNNNPDYTPGLTSVRKFLSENPDQKLSGVRDRTALTNQLEQIDRLYRFAPRADAVTSMVGDGISCARAAAAMGEKRFTSNYAKAFGGERAAKDAYAKARMITLASLNLYLKLGIVPNRPILKVLNNGRDGGVDTSKMPDSDQADWTTMFGLPDQCDCDDCQALDSPAAYFVDLLVFLSQADGGDGKSALDVLLAQRPDLAHIELTCDNIKIRLPYIDLVNEILENAVRDPKITIAGTFSITDFDRGALPATISSNTELGLTSRAKLVTEAAGRSWAIRDPGWRFVVTESAAATGIDLRPYPQTNGAEAELAAYPQHINEKAYAILAQAGYPWSLPFHLPVNEARAYLQQLNVERVDLMSALEAPAAVASNADIAAERLGLTSLERDIIAGVVLNDTAKSGASPDTSQPWTFWGFDKATDPSGGGNHYRGRWEAVLCKVDVFLNQSGLTYLDLLTLLDTYFLNPPSGGGRTLAIRSIDRSDPATCDIAKLEIAGPKSDLKAIQIFFESAHRFVRLRNRLGWSSRDLDRAITALGHDFKALIVKLAQVRLLQRQLGQPLAPLLAFWSSIDYAVYGSVGQIGQDPAELRSLYAQLFRSKSLGNPADDAFPDNAGANQPNLQGSLSKHSATIIGALKISAADFATLITGPRKVVPDDALNMASLSALHRHAVLAQSLQLSIPDLLRARLLLGDPFTNPATTVDFVRRIAASHASGFDVATLAYLLRHDVVDPTGQAELDVEFASLLDELRRDLKKIDDDNVVVPDPQGDVTRQKLALLNWNDTYIAQLVALLGDANIYNAALATLPQGIVFPANLNGRLSYDTVRQHLSMRGVMTSDDKAALDGLTVPSTDLTVFQGAVQTLFDASQTDAKTFLATRTRAFQLPQFVAPDAPTRLAHAVTFPAAWKNRVRYDPSTGQIKISGAIDESEVTDLQALSNDVDYDRAVQHLFDQAKTFSPAPGNNFLIMRAVTDTAADPVHSAFHDLFGSGKAPTERFAYVLSLLCAYIKRTSSENLVKQRLSDSFGLDDAAINALLTVVLTAPSDATSRAIADLVAEDFVLSSGDISANHYAPQLAVLARVQKIATIAARFKLNPDLLEWIGDLHASAQWLDWNALPVSAQAAPVDFATWESMVAALQLRNNPLADADLKALLRQTNAGNSDRARFIPALAVASGWAQLDIEALMGSAAQDTTPPNVTDQGLLNLAFPGDFRNGRGIARLAACFRLMRQLGASPAQLAAWRLLDLGKDPTQPGQPGKWQQAVQNASAVKNAVRSKYPDDLWLSAAEPIRERLRDQQRAALVDYLVVSRAFGKDAIDMYDHFLIDVEMTSCLKTTRLSQAICSVQMFVQQCLLKLEGDAKLTTEEAREWNLWRQYYRYWQDNRDVLIYPENWIEPSQRDDKSPFFEHLENELVQNDITADTAEDAIRHYLEQLDEVGRLEIAGLCLTEDREITHVFGRTYAVPHLYFHRQWRDKLWSPWVKVDLDIEGDHLIPAVWNGHLYLCWPVFTRKAKTQTRDERAANEDPVKYWEIQLAWSEFRHDKWLPKRISDEYVTCEPSSGNPSITIPDDVRDFKFLTSLQTDPPRLTIDCFAKTATTSTQPPPQMAGRRPSGDVAVLAAAAFQLVIIDFTVNGRTPTSDELSKIEVIARKHIDQSHSWTTAAQRCDRLPDLSLSEVTGLIALAGALEPAMALGIGLTLAGLWTAANTALASNPVYGVIALQDDARDYYFASSTGFTHGAPMETTPPLNAISRRVVMDLTPIAAAQPGDPILTWVINMQPVGRFRFNAFRADVDAFQVNLAVPPMISQLLPLENTEFVDMMMTENTSDAFTRGGSGVLGQTPGIFHLLGRCDSYLASDLAFPYTFQDDNRTYHVTTVGAPAKAHFQLFFHPHICDFIHSLEYGGVTDLLALDNQVFQDEPNTFRRLYTPNPSSVDLDNATDPQPREPREIVEYNREGAYSLYNWEIFFHIPFLIAVKLGANQRFQEACDWFHFIFDPTSAEPGGPERFWRFRPFYDEAKKAPQSLDDLIRDTTGDLALEAQALAADPFQPFLIARMRPLAFMKAVVMKYIDNLIAWGDQENARGQMETVSHAVLLYVRAARILGRRPDIVPARATPVVQTYSTLDIDHSGVFVDSLVAIESYIPPSGPPPGGLLTKGTGALGTMPLFCIPKNDKLLGYWDLVDIRLNQIRHCLGSDGIPRDLTPFAPKIDPAILVRAAAAGVDLDSILDDLYGPLPVYRFTFMLQKALEFCNEVRALGAALLAALEKRDAEQLALLRANHELALLKAVKLVKAQQVDEANDTLNGLQEYQKVITARQQYYQSRQFINSFENVHIQLSTAALIPMAMQIGAEMGAGVAHLIPDVKIGAPPTDGATYGGGNIGAFLQSFAGTMGTAAAAMNAMGALSATMGGFQRRQDDWTHQADLATKELAQVGQQIAAAEIRVAITESERDNQDLQVAQSQDVYDFMREKYTNADLYDWMVTQVSTIYFQSYKLAYDMAKRVERAYRFDLGLTDSNFIQFGYWDSLKKGLLSGERLQLDLRRMESDYLDKNKREYEITKHVSLLLHDPLALLRLKETGQCEVELPEAIFDLDFPGHYLRRIKTVALSVPCVVGPYASVNCTLTLLKSRTRSTNTPDRPYNEGPFVTSTSARQSIATSQAQNDGGLFELNFRDERYLPFEGEGAISTWRIELATRFKSFDHATIADVVLHMRYTARDGGESLKQNATVELANAVNGFVHAEGQTGLARLFSLHDDFPENWYRFTNPPGTAGDQGATIGLDKTRFPLLFQPNIVIRGITLFVKIAAGFESTYTTSMLKLSLQSGSTASSHALALVDWNGLLRSEMVAATTMGDWTVAVWTETGDGTHQRVDPKAIEDLVMAVGYTLS